jgi:hypothetical protein
MGRKKNRGQNHGKQNRQPQNNKNNTPSTNTSTTAKPVRRTELTMAYKPILILSDTLIEKIDYLHRKVEKNIEWSAVLVYSTISGSIDTVKEEPWKILVEDLILMDIGSSGYTEYDMEADDDYATELWMDALEAGKKMGHLHTHHNMNCFFSATDTQELHDNAPQHNYYLSLIVNYDNINDWCAKIAVCGTEKTVANMETTTTWKGADGQEREVKAKETVDSEKPLLFVMNCVIEPESVQEENAPEGLADRVKDILEKKKKSVTTTPYQRNLNQGTSRKNSSATTSGKGSTTSVVHMGDRVGHPHNRSMTPYSAPGRGPHDPDEEEPTGTILDLEGKPYPSSTGSRRGSVVERYSPEKIAPILIKVLDKDLDSDQTLEQVLMELELFDDKQLAAYFTPVAEHFEEDVSKFFSEELTPIHMHAIACSMYDLMKPFEHFNAFDPLDDILLDQLMEEEEVSPAAIKQMTGLLPAEQMVLKEAAVEED